LNFWGPIVSFSLILSLAALPGISEASIVLKLSTQELAQQADEIYTGEVTSTWTSADPKDKVIYTYATVRIHGDALKTPSGNLAPKATLTLRQFGGAYTDPVTKKEYRQEAFGMDFYVKGDRGVFFIQHAPDSAPFVMSQGKITVFDTPDAKSMVVRQMDPTVQYVDKSLKKIYSSHSSYAQQELYPLDAFINDINQAVAK